VERESRRRIRNGNKGSMIKAQYMHAWRCHDETHYFVHLIYMNKMGVLVGWGCHHKILQLGP
jgi:hypothetical protein